MKELRKFFATSLIGFAVAVALLAYLAPTQILPKLKDRFGEQSNWYWLASHIASRLGFLAIFSGGAWLLEKQIWKLCKPHMNFNGKWLGKTVYSKIYLGEASVPFSPAANHELRIEQDCFSIRVLPAESEAFVSWESLTADLLNEDTLGYAYSVDYKNKPNFPPQAIGYEELKVVERGWFGRPKVLSGKFAHCPYFDQTPLYAGTVRFERVRRSTITDVRGTKNSSNILNSRNSSTTGAVPDQSSTKQPNS